jgi:hypothetical protein
MPKRQLGTGLKKFHVCTQNGLVYALKYDTLPCTGNMRA